MKRILFISNGHGEDLNGGLIAQEIPKIDVKTQVLALPIVGKGSSYKNKKIPLIVDTKSMPSGGIFYLNPINLFKDLTSGLISLTITQFLTLKKRQKEFDLIVAVGDIVPIFFAYITGKNFMAFIVSTSSYYEGKLNVPFLTKYFLKSPRCLKVFTRDKYTAKDLQKQGLKKAVFSGYPIMDTLNPTNKNLELSPEIPAIALFPGSRVPEALRNLELQLKVCEQLSLLGERELQFRVALVPIIREKDLEIIAKNNQYELVNNKILVKYVNKKRLEIFCFKNAFADILNQCNLVLGMAGTAVEQAVGLGKPVVQIPGDGPQFTYRFAEAQMRLLGIGVRTINDNKSKEVICKQAALEIINVLNDLSYQQECVVNGLERVGEKGGSKKIAQEILGG